MPTTTSRLALSQPAGGDGVSQLRSAIGANATALDTSALFTQGLLVNRPAAGANPAGLAGNQYYATDTGQTFVSTGSTWMTVATISSTGVSQALQLLTAQNLRVAFGTVSMAFTTGNAETITYTIAHGLATPPVFHTGFFNNNGSSPNGFAVQNAATADNINLYLYGWSSAPAGGNFTVPCRWLALG